MHDNMIGLTEAAALLGVNRTTVHRWVRAGRLSAVQIGPQIIRVDRRDVLAMARPLETR